MQVLSPHAVFVPELQQIFVLDSLSGKVRICESRGALQVEAERIRQRRLR